MKYIVRIIILALATVGFLSLIGAVEASDTQKVMSAPIVITDSHTKSFGKLDPDKTIIIDHVIRRGTLSAGIEVIEGLKKGDDYYIILDTPGGDVNEGLKLIKAMKMAKALNKNNSICIVSGMAYSMGAVITSYCNSAYIDKLAGSMMYHQAGFGVQGQVQQVVNLVDYVVRWFKIIETDLAAQMGITYEEYKKLTTYEYWLTSEDAVQLGYVNGFAEDYMYEKEEDDESLLADIMNGLEDLINDLR